jgi:hypothetical protein
MTGHTHSLAEWAAFLSLGVGVHAAFSVFYFLLVDARPSDFDPRPVVRRAIESGRFDSVLIAIPAVKDAVRTAAARVQHAPLNAALTAAALLALLLPATETTS